MARCSSLWNYLNRSANKGSEAFVDKFDHLVRFPCATRWNSLFDALSDLTKLDELKLHDFCTDQKLSPILSTHMTFLKELMMCLKPIAITLDKLQGEKTLIMAELIPCVLNAHHLLKNLQTNSDIRICKGLLGVLIKSLETRFEHVFKWECCKEKSLPFVMATTSSPKWKLRWIDSQQKKQLATKWLLEEAELFGGQAVSSISHTTSETAEPEFTAS